MLLSLALSEIWTSFWIALLAVTGYFAALHFFGVLPPSVHLLSGPSLTVMGALIFIVFIVSAFLSAGALLAAHISITYEELPGSLRPEIERPERPWRKRTAVRHIEVLKGQLAAAEDRIDFLATVGAYIRHYRELAALGADRINRRAELVAQLIEKARARFVKAYGADEQRAAQLIDRIDALYAGDATADIRGLEERIEELQYRRESTGPEFKGTIHDISTEIRACERDVAELKAWEVSRTKAEGKSPQRERFEHAKTVEYDNERIQIWARHAKFKAYEEQLAMRRDEIEKIERRVARGELTRREADYLLRKLDEYFGEQDDRIFA
jgi:hypothetical protein